MTSRQQIEAEFAPLIAAAAQRDQARRAAAGRELDAALFDVPFEICGVPVRPMTVSDYLVLVVSGNAHLTAAEVPQDPDGELQFWTTQCHALLWLLSPEHRPDRVARDAFVAKLVGKSPFGEMMSGISEYLSETFSAAPRAAANKSDGAPDPVGCSFLIHWQHRIASAYGWSRAEFRALPLKELFQILRVLDAEWAAKTGKRLRPPLDGEVDRLWAEMLDRINGVNQEAAR